MTPSIIQLYLDAGTTFICAWSSLALTPSAAPCSGGFLMQVKAKKTGVMTVTATVPVATELVYVAANCLTNALNNVDYTR